MMNQVVANISALRGVHYACLYKDGEQLASTFPDDQQASIIQTAEIVEQAFSALEAIQKSHNEMYFSVEDKYLAVFRLHDSHIAVLLTEKKINFPLIHMGIKSASEKIRHILEEEKKQQALAEAQARLQAQAQTANTSESTALVVPTDSSIVKILDQYAAVLTSFLGPAARFVVDDCVDQWKQKYVQSEENLGHLVELIQEELDTDDEKDRFAQQIKLIVG